MALVINRNAKRKKHQEEPDNEFMSHKKPRVMWTPQLHAKFVDAVNVLGIKEAVPRKIVALMNVDSITREHVASHLQKYRLSKKKAIHQAHTLHSTMVQPTQFQMAGLNMRGVGPSTFIQSQSINSSLNIYPPSTFPIYPSSNLLHAIPTPLNQSTTPLRFAGASDFKERMATNFPLQISNHSSHDTPNVGLFLGSASLKNTSIWDYNWCTKNLKSESSQMVKFPDSSLPRWESLNADRTETQPSISQPSVGTASLEDTDNNSFWDSLDDITNTWSCLEEDDDDDVTNFIQPSCVPQSY